MTQIRVPTHRLYLDESGDHLYNGLEDISRRYLTILGCIFQRDKDYVEMASNMDVIKQAFWPSQDPDKPIILHREDIVRKSGPFAILNDPKIRGEFDRSILSFLAASTFTIINVTIDKETHLKKYKYPEHPYHYCIQVMLERYALWLQDAGVEGDVMAESRGKEDLTLKQAYRAIWHDGTTHKEAVLFQKYLTSKEIKIKPKISNSPGLQIADLLAYPLREKLLFEKAIRTHNFSGKFSEAVYNAVASKIRHQKDSGRTAGYGEILLR